MSALAQVDWRTALVAAVCAVLAAVLALVLLRPGRGDDADS